MLSSSNAILFRSIRDSFGFLSCVDYEHNNQSHCDYFYALTGQVAISICNTHQMLFFRVLHWPSLSVSRWTEYRKAEKYFRSVFYCSPQQTKRCEELKTIKLMSYVLKTLLKIKWWNESHSVWQNLLNSLQFKREL